MSDTVSRSQTALRGINLMLRAHAELRCLHREVIPVLHQIETRADLPEEQLGAALAYLEVTWLEACRHAAETDAARLALGEDTDGLSGDACDCDHDRDGLSGNARSYYAAVRRLRRSVAVRVAPLLDHPEPLLAMTPVIRRLNGDLGADQAASGGASAQAHGSL